MSRPEVTDLDIQATMLEIARKIEPGEDVVAVKQIFEEAFSWVEESRFNRLLARLADYDY